MVGKRPKSSIRISCRKHTWIVAEDILLLGVDHDIYWHVWTFFEIGPRRGVLDARLTLGKRVHFFNEVVYAEYAVGWRLLT